MKVAMRSSLILFVAMTTFACKSNQMAVGQPRTGSITHVVLVWLKTPGDESARQQLIETSNAFRDVPGMISVSAGTSLPSSRPVVDSSFDVAVVMTFRDEASLRAYESSPRHQEALAKTLKPLTVKQVVYDFVQR